jgi:hypothetical protein
MADKTLREFAAPSTDNVEPPKTDSLVKFMQNFLEKETTRNRY